MGSETAVALAASQLSEFGLYIVVQVCADKSACL